MTTERMAERYTAGLEELMACIGKQYTTENSRTTARGYVLGLMSGAEKEKRVAAGRAVRRENTV